MVILKQKQSLKSGLKCIPNDTWKNYRQIAAALSSLRLRRSYISLLPLEGPISLKTKMTKENTMNSSFLFWRSFSDGCSFFKERICLKGQLLSEKQIKCLKSCVFPRRKQWWWSPFSLWLRRWFMIFQFCSCKSSLVKTNNWVLANMIKRMS